MEPDLREMERALLREFLECFKLVLVRVAEVAFLGLEAVEMHHQSGFKVCTSLSQERFDQLVMIVKVLEGAFSE